MPLAFVTGGSGFVGGRLVERLVVDGWTVRGLARSDAAVAAVEGLNMDPDNFARLQLVQRNLLQRWGDMP